MRTPSYAVVLTIALLLAACGGSDEDPFGGTQADTGSADGAASSAAGDGNGELEAPFDASALGGETLNVVHVQPLNRSGPTPPPPVDPVIDTCAALATADFDVLVNEVAEKFGLGQDPKFTATSLGAACDYSSDTHVVRVLVGSTDQVGTAADSPAMFLPPGAGDVNETTSPDDGAVTILSEDSIGFDTPFAAFTTSGSYGVMVSNIGGTGIDYGATGALYSRLASAVSSGVANAPTPAAEAEAQLEIVGADPCSIWSVEELDAFLIDQAIGRADDGRVTDGCAWLSEQNGIQVKVEALPPDGTAGDDYAPISDGSPILTTPAGDRVFVQTAEFFLRIQVSHETEGSVFYDGTDAGVALAQNILDRLG